MKRAVTVRTVARLVATQFPQWADLPVTAVTHGGWDNYTFRLGEELVARLPSADAYVPQVEKEHRWFPALARHLPLPIPEPVAMGSPGDGFPYSWSIYRWIEGEPASTAPTPDLTEFASGLAEFLGALNAVDASDGPVPGRHNFFRGGSLDTYDAQVRESLGVLAGEIDDTAATAAWETALASTWDAAPVWVHGDVAPSNLIVRDGRLRAVIDFGCAAVGDPACDLVIAWTFFEGESLDAFRRSLSFDDGTWARGRGWALWKSLITLVEERRGHAAAAQRFGWHRSAREVVGAILAEHRRSS